ncbi:sigma-E factor negative regulatory protein [Steroidobacter sp.]|uniref:sigma-E factor negative regulatory protein n=1 Tax=Steroidobacter sp. TaxID=1978227 RepID=UPI001A479F5E|nr:sigma-E factor negative regulatory protein [Steroidobacter sp.]MBL8264877.1 sigma-E factor negative regulatory protein [Steroidobacter sp.]
MTDALNEQLSACLDGELPPAELDLLLQRVGREAELRAAVGRFSLIGEAMRAERPAVASRDFASKVMAAVAAEPAQAAVQIPGASRSRFNPQITPEIIQAPAAAARSSRVSPATVRYLRPAVGMAIAAGVAAVAVLSFQPMGQPDLAPVGAQLVAANQSAANDSTAIASTDAESSYVVPTGTTSSPFVPATRLTNYVVAHSEYSSPLGRRSVLSGVLADDQEAEALESGEAEIKISNGEDGTSER